MTREKEHALQVIDRSRLDLPVNRKSATQQ
jgi:hypothetical protein